MAKPSDNVFEVTEATFAHDVLDRSRETTVLVDFWAPWCGPCRMLGPVLERLANEPDSPFVLAKVNADYAPNLSAQYDVRGIPAVKAFRDGRVVDEFVGALPEPQVRAFIQRVAPARPRRGPEQAERLLAEQDWAGAAALFRELREKNSGDPDLARGLAQALLAQGRGCEAQALLNELGGGAAAAARLRPLADYLCRLSRAKPDQELTLLETRYRQGGAWLQRGDVARAIETVAGVLEERPTYRKGEARQVLAGLLALLPHDDPLVEKYRVQFA